MYAACSVAISECHGIHAFALGNVDVMVIQRHGTTATVAIAVVRKRGYRDSAVQEVYEVNLYRGLVSIITSQHYRHGYSCLRRLVHYCLISS